MRTKTSLALLLAATVATAAHADNGVTIHTSSFTTPEGYILMDEDPTLHIQVGSTLRRSDLGGATEDVRVRYRVNFVPQGGGSAVSGGTHVVIHEDITPLYNQPIVDDIFSFPAELLTDAVEYSIEVRISHDDGTGVFVEDETPTSVQRIGHFQRRLDFGGGILVQIAGFSNPPTWLAATQNWEVRINGGTLLGADVPVGTYIATPNLEVDRDNAGKMDVVNGQLRIIAAPEFDMSGFPARRDGLTLIGTGGVTTNEICFDLPAGIGWRGQQNGLLQKELCASGPIPLDPLDLQPVAAISGTFAGADPEVIADAYPLAFESGLWSFEAGVLTVPSPGVRFTRANAYFLHAALSGSDTLASNARLWETIGAIAGEPLTITGGPDGGISINMSIASLPTGFYTHFPLGRVIHAGGTVSIVDHKVDPATSRLIGATALVSYSRLCPPCPGEPHPDPTALDLISTTAGMLPISPTGGLHGPGSPLPLDLHVGTRPSDETQGIHDLDGFAQSHYHMPGSIVPAEDGQGTDDPGEAPASFNPARHLLTPLDRGNHNPLHPGGLAFLAGLGDHAGMNWQQFPGLEIESAIGGGTPVTYDAADWTRGYGRQSGFTGILQSDPDDVPPFIEFSNYLIALDNIGWSYLSNNTVKSITGGLLDIPYPASIELAVQELMLSCCGVPTGFDLDPSDRDKTLSYWAMSPFHINSAGFDSATGCPNECSGTAELLLKLGVDAPVGGTPGTHGGFLYPLPDGQLTNGTQAEGRESHLVVGPTTLRGYNIIPTGHAFFNNQDTSPLPPAGFQALPAAMDVSFFEDVEGLVHTNGALAAAEQIQFRRSWDDGDDNFFNDPAFDPEHRGFDTTLDTIQEYRVSPAYHPLAQKDWFGGRFDFPVLFRDLGDQSFFRSTDRVDTDLIIGDYPGEVRVLNATDAHVTFGEEFELIPKLTLSNGATYAIDEGTEFLSGTVVGAIDDFATMVDTQVAIMSTNLQTLLSANLPTVVDTAFVNPLLLGVRASNCTLLDITQQVDLAFNPAAVTSARTTIAGGVNTANSTLDTLQAQIEDWHGQLELIRNTYLTDEGFEDLLQSMIASVPNASVDPDLVEELWIEMLGTGPTDSSLKLLRDLADELLEGLENLSDNLEAGGIVTDTGVAIDSIFVEFTDGLVDLKPQIETYLQGTLCEDPAGYSDAELRPVIRAMVIDALTRVDSIATLESIVRNAVYHLNESVKTLVADIFDVLNSAAEIVARTVLFVPDAPLRAVQGFGTHFLTGSMAGYVVAEGDDMRTLRLDGRLGLHLPTQVEFEGYLEYNHLTSEGPDFCEGSGGVRAHELEIGASAGYSQFMRKARKLSVTGKWGFEDNGDLNGFAGSLELLDGGFSWAAMNGSKTSLHMAMGRDEYYLAGGISAEMNRLGFGLTGGFFVGKTCTPDPLAWLPGDETDQFDGFLPFDSEFAGGIMYGEGAANIIGRSCLARLRVGAGVGWYGLTGIGAADEYAWGGRFKGTASGELLCIISGKGEVVLDSRFRNGDYEMDGRASITRRTIWGKNKTRSLKVGYRRSEGWNLRR